MILSRWFHDASPINIEHPWKWFFLISISSLPASAGNTMQLEKPINHHVEYINWPIKIKNAAWGIYVLQCSTPLGSQKAVKTSDVWDHLLCHRSRRLTHSWDGGKKSLQKKTFPLPGILYQFQNVFLLSVVRLWVLFERETSSLICSNIKTCWMYRIPWPNL